MKKTLKIFFSTFAFAAICQFALALTVSGTITDAKTGETLIGANVTYTARDGTPSGGSSDVNGKFSIDNVPDGTTLNVSYIGYKPISLTAANTLNIQLEVESQNIDTVTVTGKNTNKTGQPCAASDLPKNAASGTYKRTEAYEKLLKDNPDDIEEQIQTKFATDSSRYECEITECKTAYEKVEGNNICEQIKGPCTAAQLPENATEGKRIARDGAEVCIPTKCKDGFELSNEQCIAIAGDCDKKDMPANATAGKRTFDATQNKVICIATACAEGYSLKDGQCDNNLTQEQSSKKLEELRENAKAMKEKEQSLENRILGAAAIGATSIGGMQLASGLAEQKADDNTEAAMTAYLATFRCTYGNGQSATLGESEIILPGGNDMFDLYQEYSAAADNLKDLKDQLGMAPGIESEVIIDKADTGLYDNAGVGITTGSFASFARAKMNPGGADAVAWAEQVAKAESKTKTGAIVAGAGIVGGVVGNLAINSSNKKGNNLFGKPVAKENSRGINDKYKALANAAQTLQSDLNAIKPVDESCGDGATGTHPNCDCGAGKNYVTETKTCVTINSNIDCGSDERAFVTTDNTCACSFGYDYNATSKTCVCTPPKREREDKKVCLIEPITLPSLQVPELQSQMQTTTLSPVQTSPVPAVDIIPEIPSAAFKLNESIVQEPYLNAINKFAKSASSETQFQGCYYVTGHTDKTGSVNLNKNLSQQRATAVQQILLTNGIPSNKILAVGKGWDMCETTGKCPNNQTDCKTKTFPSDDTCRRVTIEMVEKPCAELKN